MTSHQVARQLAIGNVLERLGAIEALQPMGEARVRAATDMVDAILAIYHGARQAEIAARAEDRRQFQHALDTAADPHAAWPPKVLASITPQTPYGEVR